MTDHKPTLGPPFIAMYRGTCHINRDHKIKPTDRISVVRDPATGARIGNACQDCTDEVYK